jgi:hypothetical protein
MCNRFGYTLCVTERRKMMVTPLKAIRLKCIDCSAYQPKEVRECPDKECPLFNYRMGKREKSRDKGKNKGSFKEILP